MRRGAGVAGVDELAEILGAPVVRYSTEPVSSAGAGTVAVERVTGTTTAGPFRLVRKRIRPPVGARAAAADDPRHVTYWRREAHAYRSGLLPATGLVAPECVAVREDPAEIRLWTREVTAPPAHAWPEPRYARAAHQLGGWQRADVPAVDWLADDQLRQRIERTDAAGGLTPPDHPGLAALRDPLTRLWDRRYALLDRLDALAAPTLCHGDTSAGNLFGAPDGGDTTVLDWATFGVSPPGFDLAHLVLGAPAAVHARNHPAADGPLLAAHLAALDPARAPAVRLGFAVAYALVAVSRLHWHLTRPDPDLAYLTALGGRALAAVPIG